MCVLPYFFEVSINCKYNILKLDGSLLCDNWYSRITILHINNVLAIVTNWSIDGAQKNRIGSNLIDYNGNEILKDYVDDVVNCYDNGDCILEKKTGEKSYYTIVDAHGKQLNDWATEVVYCYRIGNARN